MLVSVQIQRGLTSVAVHQLAHVDYNVANRVTEAAAVVVDWAYLHDLPRVAALAVQTLHVFDDIGSVLIAFVLWLAAHTM